MHDKSPDAAVEARADLITAIALVALGLVIFYLSWTMPRLEARRIHPATIPGLVPIMLGAALTLCGTMLVIRSWRLQAPGGWSGLVALFTTRQAARVAAAVVLMLVFALLLVGNLPFWLASMLFVFSFIVVFEVYLADVPIPLLRSAIWALAIAVVFGGGIFMVFERIFLVRLP